MAAEPPFFGVVGGENEGSASGLFFDDFGDEFAAGFIEGDAGFVPDEEFGLGLDGEGDFEATSEPAGEVLRLVVLVVLETDLSQEFGVWSWGLGTKLGG
jgi:hypothetical protein